MIGWAHACTGTQFQVIEFASCVLAAGTNFRCCACNPHPFFLLFRILAHCDCLNTAGLFAGFARALARNFQVIEFACSALAAQCNFCCCTFNPHPFHLLSQVAYYLTGWFLQRRTIGLALAWSGGCHSGD